MKTPSKATAGKSSTNASKRSFSRIWPRGFGDVRGWGSATSMPAALPAPPAIGFFNTCSSSALVDLLELALGPFHRVFGLHALNGLRVHVDDDVLGVRLGGLGRRWSGMPERKRLAGRLPEHLQLLVDLSPHRVLFPDLGRADRVPLIHLEPLPVVLLLVEPLQEILRELDVLRILHD